MRSRCRNGDVPDPGLPRGAAIVPNGVGDGDGPALHTGVRRQLPIGINFTMESRVTIIRDRQPLQLQRLLWPLAGIQRATAAVAEGPGADGQTESVASALSSHDAVISEPSPGVHLLHRLIERCSAVTHGMSWCARGTHDRVFGAFAGGTFC